MPFWDERFATIGTRYPDVATAKYHIDILTAHFVQHPDRFDVVVASNLFGDILSDLGPALVGSIGLAPSANINPERDFPSMFEPVHGSAPDIAGKCKRNPIGQIWAAAMMLDHLGESAAAREIERAIEAVVVSPEAPRTPDLGGTARHAGSRPCNCAGASSASAEMSISSLSSRRRQTDVACKAGCELSIEAAGSRSSLYLLTTAFTIDEYHNRGGELLVEARTIPNWARSTLMDKENDYVASRN